jgi:hypothetical protein
MAHWVLCCRQCQAEVTSIEDFQQESFVRDPYTSVIKPELPDEGVNVACPNCQRAFVYRRHELVYRAA